MTFEEWNRDAPVPMSYCDEVDLPNGLSSVLWKERNRAWHARDAEVARLREQVAQQEEEITRLQQKCEMLLGGRDHHATLKDMLPVVARGHLSEGCDIVTPIERRAICKWAAAELARLDEQVAALKERGDALSEYMHASWSLPMISDERLRALERVQATDARCRELGAIE